MRGEHTARWLLLCRVVGSSPHAWGTPVTKQHVRRHKRFIPTCVGNTGAACTRRSLSTVHPHMRGEHCRGQAALAATSGSSPHAWGTLFRPGACSWIVRFIPTCVGNTANLLPSSSSAVKFYGSSPHAWGTHPTILIRDECVRFIPTCVGNTGTRQRCDV